MPDQMPTVDGVAGQDVMPACIDLVGRCGGRSFELRYSDDHDPTVWMAIAELPGGSHEAAGGMTPGRAAFRLLEYLVDGGTCQHCHRPTGVTLDLDQQLAAQLICWYQYDPELKRFRRSCEGNT